MKKLLIIFLSLWIYFQSYTFSVCIQWSWECNDTINPKNVQDDIIIKLLLDSWEIEATKDEVENFWLEQIKAYYRALNNWITTQKSVRDANLWWYITREEMAKMISNYTINILWKTPDTTKTCLFIDSNINPALVESVTKSCQLWLMGQWVTSFRPKDSVTRAEFWTVLSRALWWSKNEWWSTYYENHLKALKSEWIMNKIDTPMNKEIRWYVMLMLMRSHEPDYAQSYNDEDYTEYDDISYVIEMLD